MGGYWAFPGGAVDAADSLSGGDTISAAALAACRELREETDLIVEATTLLHWAHWITPSARPRRFDTHFFVAIAPTDQEPRLASEESRALHWLPSQEWSAVNASSDRLIAAPTIIILRQLSAALVVYRSLVALFEGERNRVVHCVIPKLAGSRELVFPWDPEYPSLPGEGAQWDSASMAAHTGLPSRLEVPS